MWLSRAVSQRLQRPHSEARGINLNFKYEKPKRVKNEEQPGLSADDYIRDPDYPAEAYF